MYLPGGHSLRLCPAGTCPETLDKEKADLQAKFHFRILIKTGGPWAPDSPGDVSFQCPLTSTSTRLTRKVLGTEPARYQHAPNRLIQARSLRRAPRHENQRTAFGLSRASAPRDKGSHYRLQTCAGNVSKKTLVNPPITLFPICGAPYTPASPGTMVGVWWAHTVPASPLASARRAFSAVLRALALPRGA